MVQSLKPKEQELHTRQINSYKSLDIRFVRLIRVLLGCVFIILGMSGLFALLEPGLTGETSGFNSSLAGLTEIRATYGGFHLGFVIFLAWCCLDIQRYRYALLTIILMMGGSALARILGLFLDGEATALHCSAIGIEGSTSLSASWLLNKMKSELHL